MKLGSLPRQYVARSYFEDLQLKEIYPFGTFCRRSNYCEKCNYDCKLKRHIKATRELFGDSEERRILHD